MSSSHSLSFDGLAGLYDETRCLDARCFEAALDYITERFPVRSHSAVFEPGIGTGRIALPLAARGYRVAGVDISRAMLDALHDRMRRNPPDRRIAFTQADATQLPFSSGVFDMAVAVHFFYFLAEWKKAAEEILRVVRQGRPVILMHTGTGMEIPSLNDRYAEVCAAMGYSIRTTGVKRTKEVAEYYRSLGCTVEEVRDRWEWTAGIPLEKAMEYIRLRAYSFTVFVPEDIHRKAVQTLMEEARADRRELTGRIDVPNRIYLIVIRKS